VRELASYGCPTRIHVVRLLAPRLENESHIKDIDFSPSGIRERWRARYADTCRALARAAWIGEFGPLDAVVLHEPDRGEEREKAIEKLATAAEIEGRDRSPARAAGLHLPPRLNRIVSNAGTRSRCRIWVYPCG
jgi:hypothetical protein